MSFTVTLPRVQKTVLWDSLGPNESPEAAKLQDLFDKGMVQEYETTKTRMEKDGHLFRQTDGRVFELLDRGRMTEAQIQFQVKAGTLTWYIVAPKDETYQTFRDEVYGAAALGHKKVQNHCEKYWRGTNSLHVKKMHTRESEAGLNHNHYRMDNVDVDPKAVYEHLMGFVEAERLMTLYEGSYDAKSVKEKFLTAEEALEISNKFEIHWARINHQGPAKTITVAGQLINLPAREESILSIYKRGQESKLTQEDRLEFEQNQSKEEPCTSVDNLETIPVEERLKAISGGMRGLGAELAMTRQVANSKYKVVTTVVAKDDYVNNRKGNMPKSVSELQIHDPK